MFARRLGLGVAIVGLLLALGSALADVIGYGRDPNLFGFFQLTGTGVGAVVFVIGIVIALRRGPA